jgi:SSS family solute:Na+ symporter
VGSAFGLALFTINVVLGWTHLHFLYVAPILTALDAAVLVGVSVRRRAAFRATADVALWKFDSGEAEQLRRKLAPLWQDYRVQAAILLGLTASIVIVFR